MLAAIAICYSKYSILLFLCQEAFPVHKGGASLVRVKHRSSLAVGPALHPDVGGTVATRVTHLVRSGWAGRFLAEIHIEVLVDLQATVLHVTINLQEVGASLRDIGVELVIPRAVERVGN